MKMQVIEMDIPGNIAIKKHDGKVIGLDESEQRILIEYFATHKRSLVELVLRNTEPPYFENLRECVHR